MVVLQRGLRSALLRELVCGRVARHSVGSSSLKLEPLGGTMGLHREGALSASSDLSCRDRLTRWRQVGCAMSGAATSSPPRSFAGSSCIGCGGRSTSLPSSSRSAETGTLTSRASIYIHSVCSCPFRPPPPSPPGPLTRSRNKKIRCLQRCIEMRGK